MKNPNIIRKLTSRKFLVTAVSVLAGTAIAIFGHESEVSAIAGAAMVILPAVIYCIMEGRIDTASVRTIGNAAANAAEELGAPEAAERIEEVTELVEILAECDGDSTNETETDE